MKSEGTFFIHSHINKTTMKKQQYESQLQLLRVMWEKT